MTGFGVVVHSSSSGDVWQLSEGGPQTSHKSDLLLEIYSHVNMSLIRFIARASWDEL